jgi:hypothetical protein
VSWGVFARSYRVLSGQLSWILGDIWRSDPTVISDHDLDRAIVAQAVKASNARRPTVLMLALALGSRPYMGAILKSSTEAGGSRWLVWLSPRHSEAVVSARKISFPTASNEQ